MIVDALTYSSSPLLFMGIGPALIIYAGKNIVPERQRVYQVGFDCSLGSFRARHIYRSVHCSELSQAHLLPPSPLAPLSWYPCRSFSVVMAMY